MIFTPEERKALLALVVLLLLGQAVSLWEQYRRSRPDRELAGWIHAIALAREESAAPAADPIGGDRSAAFDSMRAGAPAGPSDPAEDDGPGTPASGASGPVSVEPSSHLPRGVLATGRVRINEASAGDLESLPGIGPALARRIVADRSARGPFHTPQDLLRVTGIGPRKLEKLIDHVSWEPPSGR